MYKELRNLLDSDDFSVAESFVIQGREARWRRIPEWIYQTSVGDYLSTTLADGGQLWNHQSLALDHIGNHENVVISTGTASGKSLIFRSAAFDSVLRDEESRILVFYPLKALASDQMRGWRKMAQDLGLPSHTVGRIDGSVDAREREDILERARIIIMTPDVCHAWLMPRLSMPVIKQFLGRISQVVMDEAHTLEGVFGSNFALLLRRIFAARTRLKEATLGPRVQLIASTATIANPEDHMQALTGAEFVSVTGNDDGSPRQERLCAHVVCPPGEQMVVARKIQEALVKTKGGSGFITFVDSRKGVEVLSRERRNDDEEDAEPRIMPYRAGYAAADREGIERKLQQGTLKGVVSTSALELGIDLPHLSVGLNIGVPATRKSYRQRVGRVGRSQKGAFLVIAPANAFKGFGTSYKEYHELSVEPSYLYLDNQFMQFAHARCLYEELEAMAAGTDLPGKIGWPKGFSEIYKMARPDGNRPQKFDGIAMLGGDQPQLKYPLRNVGEINFKIAEGQHSEGFGDVNESQALRECYPGGVYLHMGQAYEITKWETSGFSPCIRVRRTSPRRKTKPRIMTWINTGILPADLQEGNILIGDKGFIAEAEMQITEKVEGFSDEKNEYHAYSDLRAKNPNLRPKHRNFRTTGVILCVKESWFKKDAIKKTIADWMTQVFCREFSILPQDVGSSATRVTVRTQNESGVRGDCIVFFDQTYGSLRLTERFFTEFDAILDRLKGSAKVEEGREQEELLGHVNGIEAVYDDFSDAMQLGSVAEDNEEERGYIYVFTPGSKVYYREAVSIGTEVEVKKPAYIDGTLMYRIRVESKRPRAKAASRWVNARYVEPSGDGSVWSYALWDPEEEEYVEDVEDEEAAS